MEDRSTPIVLTYGTMLGPGSDISELSRDTAADSINLSKRISPKEHSTASWLLAALKLISQKERLERIIECTKTSFH